MSTAINIIIIILVLGVIITIHELGHYLMCRLLRVGVTEFSVGMGPAIFKFTKGETQYSLRLLPIGGYCLMHGDEETSPDDDRSFLNKPVWVRMLVTLGGPLFNFILAFVISLVLIGIAGHLNSEINYIFEDSAAEEAGLQVGDQITKLNDTRIYDFREVSIYMQFYKSEDPVMVTLLRNGESMQISVAPTFNEEVGRYQMGIIGGYELEGEYLNRVHGNVWDTIRYSVLEMRYQVKTTFLSLKYLVTGRVGVRAVSGVVGVADVMNSTMQEAKEEGGNYSVFLNILNFIILISANLGIMNLLPIPAVDGGKLLFQIFEAVTGKPIPKDKEAIIHTIGFVLLFVIMILVTFKDIWQIFARK